LIDRYFALNLRNNHYITNQNRYYNQNARRKPRSTEEP